METIRTPVKRRSGAFKFCSGASATAKNCHPSRKIAAAAPAIAVNDAGQAIAAARAGMGRARVPALLVAGMIEAGMLDEAGSSEASRRGYWLVAPRPQWRQKKVQALVAALTG